MTWVKEGGMVRLDKKYLQADYKGVSTDDIVYTIHASDGQPKYGTNSFNTQSPVMLIQQIHFKTGTLKIWKTAYSSSGLILAACHLNRFIKFSKCLLRSKS